MMGTKAMCLAVAAKRREGVLVSVGAYKSMTCSWTVWSAIGDLQVTYRYAVSQKDIYWQLLCTTPVSDSEDELNENKDSDNTEVTVNVKLGNKHAARTSATWKQSSAVTAIDSHFANWDSVLADNTYVSKRIFCQNYI